MFKERFNNLKLFRYYLLNKCKLLKEEKERYKIRNIDETVKTIIEGKSISRYGDGEFDYIIKSNNLGFQTYDKELSNRLKEILKSNLKNHIIGIPSSLNRVNDLTKNEAYFWSRFYIKKRKFLEEILDKEKEYYDSMVSRFYLPFKDKKKNLKSIEKLKEFFSNKNILIIEGENTRFGLGNNLLKDAKKIKRILGPSKNAFKFYEKLLNEACRFPKDFIILIALGPTATVMAYDLCKMGYQAIDIGHLDIEYEWYLIGTDKKVAIQYKDVNEVGSFKNDIIYDIKLKEKYESQICFKYF